MVKTTVTMVALCARHLLLPQQKGWKEKVRADSK